MNESKKLTFVYISDRKLYKTKLLLKKKYKTKLRDTYLSCH